MFDETTYGFNELKIQQNPGKTLNENVRYKNSSRIDGKNPSAVYRNGVNPGETRKYRLTTKTCQISETKLKILFRRTLELCYSRSIQDNGNGRGNGTLIDLDQEEMNR